MMIIGLIDHMWKTNPHMEVSLYFYYTTFMMIFEAEFLKCKCLCLAMSLKQSVFAAFFMFVVYDEYRNAPKGEEP
ncbi:hypothetical protein J2S02_000266 [Metabacillus niabensis]|uniref:Uncharacterized protein n=1 Tax=Metabacillus niabensis TaxID=324854 RepID=A0ABT9YVD0_9BACI|nr:hypothetical protein [Metabacillus niabensis]